MNRENYELSGVSDLVTSYHLAMLKVESREELKQIRKDTEKRMDNSIRTAIAQYFINAFLSYLEPEYMEAMLVDQMSAFDITSKREMEQNLGMILNDGTYATLFKVLAPSFEPYYNDMRCYLADLQED